MAEFLLALILVAPLGAMLAWLWVDGWQRRSAVGRQGFWALLGVVSALACMVIAVGPSTFGIYFLTAMGLAAGVTPLLVWLSRPLTQGEAVRLASKRRQRAIQDYFSFVPEGIHPNPDFKSGLKPDGALYTAAVPMHEFPSYAANLLKHKKHEWLAVGFARSRVVTRIWAHKGPDKTRVAIGFAPGELPEMARRHGAEVVMVFHNHPASDPTRYVYHLPSPQDAASAQTLAEEVAGIGVSLAEYVCERGAPHLYALYPADSLLPLQRYAREVRRSGSERSWGSLAMRAELLWR